MITLCISAPITGIVIATAVICAISGITMLAAGVVHAALILTGPHWDGEQFAPVTRALWRSE